MATTGSTKPSAKKTTKTTTQTSIVKQGAKFGLVGISNTVIDYSLYLGVRALLGVPVTDVYLVKYFSGTIAMLNSFYWNRRWVFKSQAHIGKSGLRFLLATLVSIYLIQPNVVRFFTATDFGQGVGTFWYNLASTLGITKLLPALVTQDWTIATWAFGCGVIGSAIWNFTLYKLWAFREDI